MSGMVLGGLLQGIGQAGTKLIEQKQEDEKARAERAWQRQLLGEKAQMDEKTWQAHFEQENTAKQDAAELKQRFDARENALDRAGRKSVAQISANATNDNKFAVVTFRDAEGNLVNAMVNRNDPSDVRQINLPGSTGEATRSDSAPGPTSQQILDGMMGSVAPKNAPKNAPTSRETEQQRVADEERRREEERAASERKARLENAVKFLDSEEYQSMSPSKKADVLDSYHNVIGTEQYISEVGKIHPQMVRGNEHYVNAQAYIRSPSYLEASPREQLRWLSQNADRINAVQLRNLILDARKNLK